MIRHASGDLFAAHVEALVNPVNCVGVMGAGLAKEFKVRFPMNFAAYRKACKAGEVRPGRIYAVQQSDYFRPKWIVNFPTKDDWRDPSRIEWIRDGLADLRSFVIGYRVLSLALPSVGCGLGGLAWDDVRREIEGALGGADMAGVDVVVYGPKDD